MTWLYTASLWVVTPLMILLVLAGLELGHRIGRIKPIAETQVSTVSVPLLALVGLLLAFSFGMAGDRYALRRATIVQEANAIGTFWLRTSLMPEPTKSEMRSRVRRYVDIRVEHRAARTDLETLAKLDVEAERLESELWAQLEQDAQRAPEAARVRLVVPALNAMIDDAATATAARQNRLPDALVGFLLLLVFSAGVVIGYRPREEKRNFVLWALYTAVMSTVLMTLIDLDRPRQGLITTSAAPYLRLRESLRD
jgi:hypothetical protein